MQFPPVSEQATIERAESILLSRKFRHRVFRKLGGRSRLEKQFRIARHYRDWAFPLQSSGGFGDQTLGRWLTYDEMKQTVKEFLRRHEAGEKSVFWSTDKSWVIWADLHAQYVEQHL
jgi:hypothetical protein